MANSVVHLGGGDDAGCWDNLVARLGGHPLQSRFWGEVSGKARSTGGFFLLGGRKDAADWIARVEERRLPGFGNIAWIPRGPVVSSVRELDAVVPVLRDELRARGFCLIAMSPWFETDATLGVPLMRTDVIRSVRRQRTIWIDLRQGRDSLWQGLDKQWRYGVGRAERLGVRVSAEMEPDTVNAFFALCHQVSEKKGFRLPASPEQMLGLLWRGRHGAVEAQLFIARYEGKLAAGVFVLRSGSSLHYIWGAADRTFSRQRVGEAVQWAVIEWGLSRSCRLYDLEGIDPIHNPGTYQFKKKMGGREVDLPGEIFVPLGLRGRMLAMMLSRRD